MTHGHRIRLIALPLVLLGVLAACGTTDPEPKVASGGTDPKASASAAPKDQAQQAREYVKCMRAAGVDMPDPGPDGGIPAQGASEADSAEAKKMDAAMEKCRELAPNGGEAAKLSPEDLAKMRELSKCMRDNGVPGFPDPDPVTGEIKVDKEFGADDATMRKASEKCQSAGPGMVPVAPGT